MLDVMLGNCATNGFGVQLTRANVKAHLAAILADRETYARAHPAEIQWVQRVVAEVTGGGKKVDSKAAPKVEAK